MIIALDLETTGLDKEKDFIIEFALIKFDEKNFKIVEEYTSLVNPGIEIPELNVNITGITNEMVKDAPDLESLSQKIKSFIGDFPILGHNTYFDRDFLIEKGIDIRNNIVLDTFFFANFLSIGCKSLSLESLCMYYGIDVKNAHRAYDDTKSTFLLYKQLITEFGRLCEDEKNLLKYLFFNTVDKNIIYLRNFLFEDKDYINFDEFIALQLDKIKKIDIGKEKNINSKLESFEKYYKSMKNLEKRKNQIELGKKIEKNFLLNIKSVIEAPTGIGKTFAYLIPSIIYSKKSGQKVYISTKTKILQDQIYYKEIEKIKDNLNLDFTYTKIKGKNNYISLKSYFEFIRDFDIDYEKLSFLSKITIWLTKTEFGELDELFYINNEYKFLKYVNADNNKILTKENPYLNQEFVYINKQRLEKSDIIIVNHSLLFSDLKNDFSYFGELNNLVIDEAHSVEDVVTETLKKSFSLKLIDDLFFYIENIFKKNLFNIQDLLIKKEKLYINLKEYFDIFHKFLKSKTHNENYIINSLIDKSFYDNLEDIFFILGRNIVETINEIKNILGKNNYDFGRELAVFDEINDIIYKFLDKSNCEDFVKITYYHNYDGIRLEYTILNVGSYLKNNFWDKLDNCFLISATLAVGDDFSYIQKSLSLDNFEFLKFESDFDYSKQAVLYLPSDIGNIKNNFFHVKEFLKVFFETVKGNTMVLFTSLSLVRETYLTLNFFIKSFGSKILAQSFSGSKNKLLEFYLAEPNKSIILGTDSFWEGVDLPGENLKYLIIHKMPFMVPTDPIYVSRSSLYENPFNDYSIPKSVLKLKQGFGRLIRTRNDYGAVIFLDNRIYSTQWGQIFYKSFPEDIKKMLIKKEEIILSIQK